MPTRAVRHRFAQSDTWLLELFLGCYTFVWGLGYANPLTDTFAQNPRAMSLLAQFPGGEPTFGVFVTGLGALALWSTLRLSRQTRGVVIGAAGLFWFYVLVAVGTPTGWAAGGLPHFALVALAHWFCWARLRWRGGR